MAGKDLQKKSLELLMSKTPVRKQQQKKVSKSSLKGFKSVTSGIHRQNWNKVKQQVLKANKKTDKTPVMEKNTKTMHLEERRALEEEQLKKNVAYFLKTTESMKESSNAKIHKLKQKTLSAILQK